MVVQSANSVRNNETRRVMLHVNFNGSEALNFVLNSAENISGYYASCGTDVEIRIVAHGLCLHMLRVDSSPVKERLKAMAAAQANLSFYTCENARDRITKSEGKAPDILSETLMVPSGIVEFMELQRAGWQYLKP